MNRTADRLLRLLTLLQSGRAWSGAALGERLEVDRRTVRRDIDRLRGLGYAVHASSGPGGGYRLASGARMPPLLLDDDEAVAIMVALHTAAGGLARVEETAAAVRLKLDQILPPRLRAQLDTLRASILPLGAREGAAEVVEPGWLTALATACRESRGVGFAYRDRRGRDSLRRTEPQRLVHTGYRWYLVAWDLDRADWRNFRVDRLAAAPTLGGPVERRRFPGDVADFVQRSISYNPCRHSARVELSGSAAENAAGVAGWIGVLEAVDPTRCVLTVGAQSPDQLVGLLVGLGRPFRLLDPPGLAAHLERARERLSAAGAAVADPAARGGLEGR